MKKLRKLKKGLAMLLTATMVVGLMPGVGTLQVSATESDENTVNTVSSNEAMTPEPTPEQTVGQTTNKLITAWQWIDEEEYLDEETGSLALPGASEQRTAYFDDVTAFLPTRIQATVVNADDSENSETGAEETIPLGDWSCDNFPEEGAYSGSYTFTATLPEGYALSEEAEELTITVELGGAQMYDDSEYVNGFCQTYNATTGNCSNTNHTDCSGYQPATLTTDKYDIDGDENKENVYEISNAGQLYWFAGLVNGTLSGVDRDIYANAVLTDRIIVNTGVLDENGDLNTGAFRSWTPIGGYYNTTVRYNGIFDGNNNTISGLYYDESSESINEDYFYVGLFGLNGGTIKNVGIVDSYFGLDSGTSGYLFGVGGLCGVNDSTIENCDNEATVTVKGTGNTDAFVFVGGVCGNNSTDSLNSTGIIKNCKNAGKVSSTVSTGCSLSVGGVCGSNCYGATIENCYNEGKVNGTKNVGGVCGYNDAEDGKTAIITNCYNTNTVSGTDYVGGVCGYNDTGDVGDVGTATITNCYNTNIVSGTNYVGGVCGYNDAGDGGTATITNCYNTNTVSGTKYVGGVCGYNNARAGGTATITNCYNINTVSGTRYAKGVCGGKSSSSGTATITNCYYLDTTVSDRNAKAKTATQFANGEVAYLLNGEKSEGTEENPLAWYQNLPAENGDTYPLLDSGHGKVYQCTPCTGVYSNTSGQVVAHIFEMGDDENHKCKNCGLVTVHSTEPLTYTADEDTNKIMVKCGDDCGKEYGTVTLSAPTGTLTYDGNAKTATADTSGVTGVTISDPTITYKKGGVELPSAPTDAGTYTASITLGEGAGAATVSVEFTIARKPVTITANDASKTYGETDPALSYTVSDGTPLVDSEELSGKLSRLEGENAGTYNIQCGTVTNDNNPNYDITFNEGTFTINKANTVDTANCTMVLNLDSATNTYTATITKAEGAEYQFGESGEWSTENTLTGIAHDTEVTGYIRIAGDDNHNPGAKASMTLTSGHGTMTHYEAKAADCENDGNLEYWYCESCKKYFSDEDGETEITKEAVTKAATGHRWNTDTYEMNATHHWHNCQNENCPVTDNSLKDGYGEHVDADGDGKCDTCNLASYTIKLYNRTKDDANAIYDMPAVDRYFQGQEVTVIAADKSEDGYEFLGWYNVTEYTDTDATAYDSAALTNKLKYTFTIEQDVRLVAVYQALGTAQVTINVVNGAEYYVGSDTTVRKGTTETVKLGSKLVLTAVDQERVYQWQNESGKVLGTGSSLSLTITGSTSVTLVYSTADENVGYVQFVSDFGQVISATLCTASTAELLFPEGPSKFGYTFNYWTMDGTSEAKLADITSAIAVGSKLVTVTPFYSQNEMPKVSITVKKAYNGISNDVNDIVYSDLTYGSTMTIPEVSLEGYVFKCWSSDIAGTNVLSYDKEYFVQVTVNQTIYAIFVAPESEVKAQPVITITDLSTIEDGSTHKISCAATRNVPDGYTLIEQGMLYGVGLESLTEETFVYGTENVKRYVSSDMAASGIFRLIYRLSSDTTVVYFRGYMIVKNNETGNQEYIYSDITKGSYNSIKNIQ